SRQPLRRQPALLKRRSESRREKGKRRAVRRVSRRLGARAEAIREGLMPFILDIAEPGALRLSADRLDRLGTIIEGHIREGRYPGAQIAVARHGKLALFRSFGQSRLEPQPSPARDDSLWLLYSNTKVITAAAIWVLVEEGALTFSDRIAEHVPDFAQHGKGEITLLQVLTHQGGFPSAAMDLPPAAWEDHQLLRRLVSDFTLEWTPGSRVEYHRLAAHWVAAVLIEAVTRM